jgi:ABC-type uncharacterized transport system substrate-binding protein
VTFGFLAVAFTLCIAPRARAELAVKKCLHVASYEAELDWTAGIDKSLRENLKGTCTVETFFMETKKNPDLEYAKKRGLEAKNLAEKIHADIVITSDDNAVKWLILPYYQDAKMPVVFTGVNWSIKPYNLPFKNTTGVIEVAPIDAIIYEMKKALKDPKTVAFLTIDTETERKEFPFVSERFKAAGLKVNEYWAKDFADWKKKYVEAEEANDFVYFSNKYGAKDWKDDEAFHWAQEHQKKLGASTYDFTTAVVPFTMAKSAAEQGALGADQVKMILSGKDPQTVPVTTNKLYDAEINSDLLAKTGIKLTEGFMHRAKVRKF